MRTRIALYTDRAGWAFHTPTAGGPVDRTHLTQVGRAFAHLASSPSAPTPPRPAVAASASTAPYKAASSTNCTWRASPRSRRPMST